LAERVLVTGGAGFLGSHLCEWLVRRGHDVLCVDNFYTGNKMNLRAPRGIRTSRSCATTSPFHCMSRSIRSSIWRARRPRSITSSIQFRRPRPAVHGAINMLGLAKRLRAKIPQASTSEGYGDPTVHPQPESYLGNVNQLGRRACYDEGKRCAETLFFDYHRQHGVPIRVARIFNTYGPRMQPSDGRVVSNFIVQALRGRADHGLWRRPPDAVLLLRRCPDRGTAQADGDRRRRDRPDQPRQSPRGPGPRTRQADRWHDRIEIQDPVPSRCRPTTRASGSRTSPRRGGCWIGSPRCRSRKSWAGPSPISRNGCGRPSEVRLRRKRSARGRRRPAAPDPLPRRRVSRGPR
jgi:hypothetical protein